MAEVDIKLTIAKPVSEVFNAIIQYDDIDSLKQWQPALRTLGITAGDPVRTGTMIAMTRQFLGNNIFVNADITDLQRNKRLELKGIHGRFPFRREIEFTPSGRETIIRDRFIIGVGWLYFLYRPFLTSALKGQLTQEWQMLKKQLGG